MTRWSLPLTTGLLLLVATSAGAQIPDKYENLKILDKNIDQRALVTQMRAMAGALGVRCNHCHVGEDPNSLVGYDWVSDEKASKRTARDMMRMVQDLNESTIPAMKIGNDKPVTVSCVTCHRGQLRPQMIEDVLQEAVDDGGMESLTERYRELRERYYGRHTFDFSANMLSNMAQEAAMANDMAGAKELLQLNLEYYPEDAMTYVLLGRIAAQEGDTEAAVGYIDKAIEYQEHEGMKERLRQMKKQMQGG